jgi:predicted dehydrogenase
MEDLREAESVRIAVVGLGYWGPNLLRNLHQLPRAEPVIACDRDPNTLARARAHYPALRTTRWFDEVLADDGVDAVVIATPVATHYPLARAALESGKHVMVEKPLAASSRDAEDLIELAHENNLVLMPGHTFLYSPAVIAIADLIDRGALGEIYFLSMSRVNLGLHQQDVSVIWDLGPHDFSILLYWLRKTPERVSAWSRDCVGSGKPDVAFVTLGFPGGAIAHVELSWLAPSKLRRTTVVGSEKMVVYDDVSTEPVRIFDSGVTLPDPDPFGKVDLTYRTGDIVSPRIDTAEPLLLELEDFRDAVVHGVTPRSDSSVGLAVVRLAEAAHESLERDGTAVAFELDGLRVDARRDHSLEW